VSTRAAAVFALSFAAAAGVCVCRLRTTSDPRAFYAPDAYLAASERTVAEICGVGETRFAFFPGSPDAAFAREEACGASGASVFLPSSGRQRTDAALAAAYRAAKRKEWTQATGIAVSETDPAGFLAYDDVRETALGKIVAPFLVPKGTVVPVPASADDAEMRACGAAIVDPSAMLRDYFARLSTRTLALLEVSAVFLFIVTLCAFKGDVFRYIGPVALALFWTLGFRAFCGPRLSTFDWMALFVVIGLGFDYVIFARSSASQGVRRTVRYSFLTSLVGLGALAFTSFPVTRSMGFTFAGGLFFMWLSSRLFAPGAAAEADTPWYKQREQSAGRIRLLLLWWAYRVFGKTFQKLVFVPVFLFIYPFCTPAKRALRAFYAARAAYAGEGDGRVGTVTLFRHLLGFAWSLMDRMDVCTGMRHPPRVAVRHDDGWRALQALVAAGKGAFVFTSHVGTAEVLPALSVGGVRPPVHAFQQMGHDAVFTRFFEERFDASAFTLHAVEDIGVETAVEMKEAIGKGALVMMAGDRVSAGSDRTLAHPFFGRTCRWPEGVFVFARLMKAPVFHIACVRTGFDAYEVHVAAHEGPLASDALLASYAAFLEREALAHPSEWFHFHTFFDDPSATIS